MLFKYATRLLFPKAAVQIIFHFQNSVLSNFGVINITGIKTALQRILNNINHFRFALLTACSFAEIVIKFFSTFLLYRLTQCYVFYSFSMKFLTKLNRENDITGGIELSSGMISESV